MAKKDEQQEQSQEKAPEKPVMSKDEAQAIVNKHQSLGTTGEPEELRIAREVLKG